MSTLLVEGFTDAYRNLGNALRLFWPVLATIIILYAAAFLLGYFAIESVTTPIGSGTVVALFFVIGLCGAFYMYFTLCQGAVGWHRRVLLNESPGWVSPLPRRRGFQYALAVFLFALPFLIAQIPVAYFLLPWMQSVLAPIIWDANAGNPTPEQLEAIWSALLLVQGVGFIVSVVLTSIILWLLRSWLLAFPHISIRTVQPAYGQIRSLLTTPASLVGSLLIVYFLPSVLSLLYVAITPLAIQFLPWVAVATVFLQLIIPAFCFLWGLSILSKTYARATAGKIHHADTSAQV